MDDLDPHSLLALLDSLESEQALWEERAHISFRLTRMCEARIMEIEHSKEEVQALLTRLADAEQVYGKRVQQ